MYRFYPKVYYNINIVKFTMKGFDNMQKEITINELQTNIEEIGDIKEPIIVRRKNKKDFVIVDLEEYQNLVNNISSKLL